MRSFFRLSAWSVLFLVLNLGCRSGSKSSTSSASTFSCTVTKDGSAVLCNQYQDLTGTALTSIQSECELRKTDGYSWAVAACPNSTIGTCALPATAQRPATSTQFYYGAAFSSQGTAAGMCDANSGTFKSAS